MAASLVPPDTLKQIKPYLTLATQLEQKNEKAVAYYCRSYAVQYGITINKTAPDAKKFLIQLMDLLESAKSQNKNDESIQSQIVGQAYVERYALNIFDKADQDDRQSLFSKNLVKQFYTAGLLFDVINYFGELSEDLIAKKQYAKRKAMYLNRCFQTGETPIPGPLIGGEDGNNEDENRNSGGAGASGAGGGSGGSGGYGHASSNPSGYNRNEEPTPKPRSSGSARNHEEAYDQSSKNKYQDTNYNNNDNDDNSHTSAIPTELLQKAQKLCKFAGSALQYEDIPTAITNLEQCLQLLKASKLN